jgi:hypothetical protein
MLTRHGQPMRMCHMGTDRCLWSILSIGSNVMGTDHFGRSVSLKAARAVMSNVVGSTDRTTIDTYRRAGGTNRNWNQL